MCKEFWIIGVKIENNIQVGLGGKKWMCKFKKYIFEFDNTDLTIESVQGQNWFILVQNQIL